MSRRKKAETEARLVGCVVEDHGQPVFGVSFWPGESVSAHESAKDESVYHLASVGGNRVSVYEVDRSRPLTIAGGCRRPIELRQSYVDEDEFEKFYACSWSCGMQGTDSQFAVLAAAGHQGIAKVIDCAKYEMKVALAGHGNAINDMCFHAVDAALLLTASKDESIRLWNVRTATCVAVFAGDRGHRDEVLSVDVHVLGGVFCSAGMDNTVKIWQLDSKRVEDTIRASHETVDDHRPFPTIFEQFPIFSSADVHSNYVDCARWAGSLLLSKSTANRVMLWTPDPQRTARSPVANRTDPPPCSTSSNRRGDDAVLVLRELELPGADIWFLRFDVDPRHELVAAGNKLGKVAIWRVDADISSPVVRLSQNKCNSAVRQVAFSPDSKLLAYSCDDASVWIYDVSSPAPVQTEDGVSPNASTVASAVAPVPPICDPEPSQLCKQDVGCSAAA